MKYVLKKLGRAMSFSSTDIVPLSQARARLSELADEARSGSEKIITKNGEGYVALIGVEKLDHYHRLERERIHLLLLQDAADGLANVAAGKVRPAREALAERRVNRR